MSIIQSENPWITRIFAAKQAKQDGIVRRSIKSVSKFASNEELIKAVNVRNFQLLENKKQYLILCNTGVVQRVV